MKRALILIAVIALAGFGLAACGGDDDDDETTAAETTTTETAGGGGAASTVEISSPSDGLAYNQTELTAKAGSVTIDYSNPQGLSHDVVIEDSSGSEVGKTDLVSEGDASTTVDLQPGTYTFFCDVPGHREGGMEGTLTVN